MRLTRVHVALAVFVACALLSVVLDARYLNHTGDFMLSIKKLPLLVSYLSIFVIVASSVRRTEVPAFMTYSLVLAVICGLEIIYEYHFHQNLFVTWTQSLLPRPFELVGQRGEPLGHGQPWPLIDYRPDGLWGGGRGDDVDGAADRDLRDPRHQGALAADRLQPCPRSAGLCHVRDSAQERARGYRAP